MGGGRRGHFVRGFGVGEGGDGAVFWDVGVHFWGLGRGFLLASFVGLGFLGMIFVVARKGGE